MRPAEVLDCQADLAGRTNDRQFQRIVEGTLTAGGAPYDGVPVSADVPLPTEYARQWGRVLPMAARAAEAYHVSPDMSVLVRAVAAQLDDLDRFDLEAVPTRQGIVRFDDPLPMYDVRGRKMLVHWVVWSRMVDQHGRPLLALWMFNDWHDPDEVAAELIEKFGDDRLRDAMGRWGYIGSSVVYDQERAGPAWVEPDEEVRARLLEDGVLPHAFTNTTRYMHALFLLLNQTIVRSRREDVPRPFARRARRAGIPARVTVITLRRAEYVGEGVGEAHVEWSHRWLVRSHLRWQACGPNHPLAVEVSPGVWRARIVILPYVKGPEGKPLIITGKVNALRR